MGPFRSFVVLLVVATAVLGSGAPLSGAPDDDPPAPSGPWLRPVDGPVVRPFSAPAHEYGAGHRGADLTAAPGTVVRSANDGVVTFAGPVAGILHVVVGHGDDLRLSYSFLASAAVRVGQRVTRGQPLGTTGGEGPDHGPDVLHLGLRVGDRYVDPMLLFEPSDLTEMVRLVPHDEPDREPWIDPARERGELRRGLAHADSGGIGGLVGDAVDAAGEVVERGRDAADVVTDAATDTAGRLVQLEEEVLRGLADVTIEVASRTPSGMLVEDLLEIGDRAAAWWRSRDDCSADSPAADGTGGSGHLLLAVGGINSSGAPDDPTFTLDTDALGYYEGEVSYYSYAPDGGEYAPDDTWGDLMTAGRQLGEQLEELHRAQPGREVDLIAHSQGGVVVDVFLQYFYDAADPDYPPIGTVVTLSSPHEGAPAATAAAELRSTRTGRALLDAGDAAGPLPPSDGASTRQLAEGSELMRDLWVHRLPEHVDFTTIGASDDFVVPANQTDVPGATGVVVDVAGPMDHSSVPSDPRALQVVRAALEGRAPPCVGWADGLRGAVEPVLITRLEHAAGDLGWAVLP